MEATTPAVTWPPRVGDYARVRASGALGEIIGLDHHGAERYYTLNLLRPGAGAPVVLGLDGLEPAWPEPLEDTGGRSWDDPTPASRERS